MLDIGGLVWRRLGVRGRFVSLSHPTTQARQKRATPDKVAGEFTSSAVF